MDRSGGLEKVELQADVYMTCIQHSFSTENYEVMGMLIGVCQDSVAKISSLMIMRRSDKKKDRVEISSEQLLHAMTETERMAKESGLPLRVVGWYHSHPHITVCPSHVDVRTQMLYQKMDPTFVGLIFSVFSEEKDTKIQEVLLTCFQSFNEEAREIPLEIVYTQKISTSCLQAMTDLPKILVQEEEELANGCKNHHDVLASIHNKAVLTRSLAHITDIVTRPLIKNLSERIALNERLAAHLRRSLHELSELERRTVSKF